MTLVPKHIKELKPYVAGKSKKEFKRKFGDRHSIKLSSNENPLGCSPKSIERVKAHINSCNRYPDSSGFELREKLADKYNLDINNVIIGSGSEGIMSNVMRTFLSGGDKIISSMNSFIGFRVLADASGYQADWVPMKNYHYDLDGIINQIDSQTKIIYLANPDNPTGTYFTIKEFDQFMDQVPERVLVILDEAYFEYAQHLDDYPDSMHYRYDNVITLRSFSKAHGLAGFRVGYGLAHEALIYNLLKVKLPFEPSWPAQVAAMAALDDKSFIQNTVRSCKEGMKYLEIVFKEMDLDYIPSAANFLTVVFNSEEKAQSFTDSMLHKGIILRHLAGWGLPHSVRITIGKEEENAYLISCLSEILSEV